jgi:hypothetical protein
MKSLLALALVSVTPLSLYAEGPKPCDELKGEIAQKLEAKNVTSYSLDVVPTDQVKDGGKVVGSCEGGTKKIVYSRTSGAAQTSTRKPAAESTTAQAKQ